MVAPDKLIRGIVIDEEFKLEIERRYNGWDDLCQQLAAALAVCKVKDELIRMCAGIQVGYLKEALAIQPNDSALKAWLGEPVFIRRDQLLKVRESPFLCRIDPIQQDAGWIPLYAPKGMK
jgi:hypothetical protein